MPSDDRSQVSLERYGHAVSAVNTNEPAAVGVEKMNLGMPTSLVDSVHLEASRTQRSDGVAERRAH
jgi:hypothetical protein